MINENYIIGLITEELTKKDVIEIMRKDKTVEKKMKEVVTTVVTELFKVLWQHNAFYKQLIQK